MSGSNSAPDPLTSTSSLANHQVPTEAGNALEFVRLFGSDYFYSPENGCWFSWDGRTRRWVADTGHRLLAVMLQVVREKQKELPHLSGEQLREAVRHIQRSERAASLKGALEIARSYRSVPADRLDSNPNLLQVENGTLDLDELMLREPDRANLVTKLAPVEFKPDARLPELEKYLGEVTGHDPAYIAFLGRLLGYLLTGSTSEDKFFILLGPSRTGKSTLLNMLERTLGDYAGTIPFGALLQHGRDRVGLRPELAQCAGKRVVMASEVPEGRRFDSATVKGLTGGDTITVHGKYQAPFQMRPMFKLLLATNRAPELPDGDDACRERLMVLPFEHRFREIDNAMRGRLQRPDARAALLAFAVRGLANFHRDRLGTCEAVERATKSYWDGTKPGSNERTLLDKFFANCTLLDPSAVTDSKDLNLSLAALARESGVPCPSPKRLAAALQARGVERHRGANARRWRGVRLVQARGSANDGVTR